MNVVERLLFRRRLFFSLGVCNINFFILFPQFSGIKENKILIKYNISPRLFILFILIVTILMHYTLGF